MAIEKKTIFNLLKIKEYSQFFLLFLMNLIH